MNRRVHYHWSPAQAAKPAWPASTAGERGKRVLDIVVALLVLPPALAIMAVAAVLIKLTSRGPVLYTQSRLGRHGQVYRMFKLRTMAQDSERISGPCWAKPNDDRVTLIGRLLRALHIDELPQLWNVLRGEMSLVGPRPERPEFLPMLERAIPGYRQRLVALPGLTGLAQVQLPADEHVQGVRRKTAYDLFYVSHRNCWLDVRILFATVLHLAQVPVGCLRRMTTLPGGAQLVLLYETWASQQGFARGRARKAGAKPCCNYGRPARLVRTEKIELAKVG